jgi:NADH-quinone oxidoreductase subunit N
MDPRSLASYQPEILLAVAGGLIIFAERLLVMTKRAAGLPRAAAVATAAACAAAAALDPQPVAAIILALAACAALLGLTRPRTRDAGEFHFLFLVATIGLLVMAKATTFLMAFIGIETTSLTLAALIAFDKSRPGSAEAGLKFFLLSSVASAILLYGFSLLYGLTGTLDIAITGDLLAYAEAGPLLIAALAMITVGFGFKVAAAPFHLWAPDTYQGAPLPVAAFVASASKVAGLWLFLRIFGVALIAPAAGTFAVPGWVGMILLAALLSMTMGNLVALAQTSFKRLLAWSAVAHAGYLLLGFAAAGAGADLVAPLLYYVATYALAALGAFAIAGQVAPADRADTLDDFRGLARRSPAQAACLAVFLLSLAGLPPLAGFFGKFWLFVGVAKLGGWPWLAGVAAALALSAVSFYYYLRVLKAAFVLPPDPAAPAPAPLSPIPAAIAILLALAVTAAGLFPEPVIAWLRSANLWPGG